MRKTLFLLLSLWICATAVRAQQKQTPDQLFGPLFKAVQLSGVFPDNKTFVDCVPKTSPDSIMARYEALRQQPDFDLAAFVTAYFEVPEPVTQAGIAQGQASPVKTHIRHLWNVLQRDPNTTTPYGSLLPLPYPYIVPGGRFREIYYWDSYFTMLGLEESGRITIIENMIRNFAFLLDRYGHIPNGNRTYFLSRSQPPFFSLMLGILAKHKGDSIYVSYLPQMEKEYAYWMDRSAPTRHVVKMPDGSLLNRYYDRDNIPRQESYKEDVAIAAAAQRPDAEIYRELRSGAESGWDFSSRWFGNGKDLHTIRTTALVPVDLNCLLWHLESTLAKACSLAGQQQKAAEYTQLAGKRKRSIERYCWSEKAGWYLDYDLPNRRHSPEQTLAGMFPFFTGIAARNRIKPVQENIRTAFLQAGGVVTTLKATGQQWDYPNGWAPLQWVTITGLDNYGAKALAKNIAERWVALNIKVYRSTGKLMEKYNVTDLSLTAGGGEYPTQDGFGWTNGVLLKLMKQYDIQVE
ncbi:alpha,alpha-trehalase TreA [Chitinophaga japonensis]|uniref:Alpha,alpha-trehalase n=1 Tax=Chitinophaga japonensis TaxID=104662 RepID=A0A562STW0_CHIJA|nr:alpha,alpha-trehalase TreA [Chitinophaga japonensis]TWI84196.1 alpha,alpha-trehalase [Chitinophaga japonensis]